MLLFSDSCSVVNVLHTTHNDKGDNGQYFFFDENDFGAKVGLSDWSGKTFKVFQKGSRDWNGKVKVWKGSSSNGAHGRRDEGSSSNQWAANDEIEICRTRKYKQLRI